jgi:hypothetical protein
MIQPEAFPDIPDIFQDDDKGSFISYESDKNFVPNAVVT